MLFSSKWLSEIFRNCQGASTDGIPIEEVTTDSRKKTKKSLFIPLRGESFDGHRFLKDAFENGAIATLWEKGEKLPEFLPTDFPVYFVEDSLAGLHQLAHAYRTLVDPIVIGVTGSNGKTTTKDLIGTVVKTDYKTHQTNGNFNNQIGLPLTILSMEQGTEVLVLEMGMNHFGEIEALSNIAKPDYGVITNIGESHLEFLGSREGIAQAKAEIMAGMKKDGVLLIDGDEPLLRNLHNKKSVVSCGFRTDNQFVIENVKLDSNKTSFAVNNQVYEINMLGRHNAQNAAFAIILAQKLHIPYHKIAAALNDLIVTGMRFEVLEGENGAMVINDAYNASPTSMKASINVVIQMQPYTTKVLVLGDIFELGKEAKELHSEVAETITDEIDVVLTTGSDAVEISKAVAKKSKTIRAEHFESKEQLTTKLQPYLHEKALILLKASRGMKFETIMETIVKK